jgi:transposase-like protein
MGIMNGLKNRRGADILLAAVDGLTGFPDAIAAVFPNKDRKAITVGLKNISGKWTMPIGDWDVALNQFAVIYGEDRVPL